MNSQTTALPPHMESGSIQSEAPVNSLPVTYWDYIQVDDLLSLQNPKTDYKDEEVFILYHQVTELILKMMLHEIRQLSSDPRPESVWIDKTARLNRYVSMLINSFDVMKHGMNPDEYNTFRRALSPASGFQSAQFRFVEIYCTRPKNLVRPEAREHITDSASAEDYFHDLYWKDAGLNRQTGEKSLTLQLFEDKYLADLTSLADSVRGATLEERVLAMDAPSDALLTELKQFDRLYNIEWPLVHLRTAEFYLERKGEQKAATGGSDWKKYLHPRFQGRRFFPHLWSESEIAHWGMN